MPTLTSHREARQGGAGSNLEEVVEEQGDGLREDEGHNADRGLRELFGRGCSVSILFNLLFIRLFYI